MEKVFDYNLVLKHIDFLARNKRDVPEIVASLEKEFNYSREYMDKLFLDKYKITLTNYIKRIRLICAYDYWVSIGKPYLSEKKDLFGIKAFKSRFKKIFDCTPEDVKDKNVDLKNLLPGGEIYDVLEKSSCFNDFKITNKNVWIELDPKQCLIVYLSSPVYVVPRKLWREISASDLSDFEKYFLTVSYSRSLKEHKLAIEIPEDDMEYGIGLLNDDKLYIHEVIGELVLFHPKKRDVLYKSFEDGINEILPYLDAEPFALEYVDDVFLRVYSFWKSNARDLSEIKIENFAHYLEIGIESAIEELWDRANTGLIRYGLDEE